MARPHHEKRLRVQSARSTNGCQTCKQRRIKCDEKRPTCQRCLTSLRACQYAQDRHAVPGERIVIYRVQREVSTTPNLLRSEKRALHYYRCQAALQMTAPFQSDLWRECIYQLADRHDFVMSAIVSLSTMHEAYQETAAPNGLLQAEATRHYNKAIKAIAQARGAELSVDAVLTTITLFHSIECLRGGF